MVVFALAAGVTSSTMAADGGTQSLSEKPSPPAPLPEGEGSPGMGSKHLLVVCGHPGDDEYRERFAGTIDTLVEALETRGAFSREQTQVLFGTPEMQSDGGPRPARAQGPCTSESLAATVE
jgi:hypothetical protein